MWCIIPIIGPTFSLMLITGWTAIQLLCIATGHPIAGGTVTILSLFAWGFAF